MLFHEFEQVLTCLMSDKNANDNGTSINTQKNTIWIKLL